MTMLCGDKYSIGLYEKAAPDGLTWREKLDCARECGYDYMEISIDESDERLRRLDWTLEERIALKRTMKEAGLPIRSMCLSGHRRYPLGSHDPAVRERGMEIMKKALELADDLGVRTIQLAGYDVYYEEQSPETRRFFAENLSRACDMAAVMGISMGFETMETPFMDTVEKSMRYVTLIDSPYLGVYPDAGNLSNAAAAYGADVTEDLRLGAGHIVALHLKPTKPGVYRNMYFDDPDQRVDFEKVISTAWELGVRRYVTELWSQGRPDWRENIRKANRSMRAILDRQPEE